MLNYDNISENFEIFHIYNYCCKTNNSFINDVLKLLKQSWCSTTKVDIKKGSTYKKNIKKCWNSLLVSF